MKILQINTVSNSGSTGRIAEGIGKAIIEERGKSCIAFGRENTPSISETVKIGSKPGIYYHVILSRLFDSHGYGSKIATKKFLRYIEEFEPDLIHLHNIHAYYLNYTLLFQFLKKYNKPVVWTLHDCWSFTGHCAYYSYVNCTKWQSECSVCPNLKNYPKSFFLDNSSRNFRDKKNIFNSLHNLTIVTPSNWLAKEVSKSFLKKYPIRVINNGIDLKYFKPSLSSRLISSLGIEDKYIILGVASVWEPRKGLEDFIKLSAHLENNEIIVLVGVSDEQTKLLPENIIAIPRTESIEDLSTLYASSGVFLNTTYEDNFPTTNIEALACGTPVITYNTGGSIESINESTGIIVEQGDIEGVRAAISKIKSSPLFTREKCHDHAVHNFDQKKRFKEYVKLYLNLIDKQI